MNEIIEPAAGGNFLENKISNIEFMNENNDPETKTNSVGDIHRCVESFI